MVGPETLVVLPASPDGRDLAPRLAAATGRPLVARAVDAAVEPDDDGTLCVRASLTRVDDHLLVPVEVHGPAVVTLATGGRPGSHDEFASPGAIIEALHLLEVTDDTVVSSDPELLELLEPDLHTMDLSHATRVLAGGAGLVPGLDVRGLRGVGGGPAHWRARGSSPRSPHLHRSVVSDDGHGEPGARLRRRSSPGRTGPSDGDRQRRRAR